MKFFIAFLIGLFGIAIACAQEPTLQDARRRLLKGDYEVARAQYQDLAKSEKFKAAATIGISQTLESEGEYDKALAVVDGCLKTLPESASLLARQAELLFLRGRWETAEKAAESAIKIDKENFLARWVRAQVYRDRGDLKKADAEFRWFVRTYSERSDKDKDIKDPEDLVLVALAAAENARWHSLSDQFDFILKEVYGDAVKADKDYWPAEYHAGMVLLEKFNAPEALEAFGKAQTINASSAEVLTGLGLHALQNYNMKEADDFARRALRVNPRFPEALRLQADIFLAAGEVKPALKKLEEARAVNPRDEVTLARIAACHYLAGNKQALEAIVKEVGKHNTRPGVFYSQLAERLDERRHFDDAEKYYKESIRHRPMLAGPQASMGLLFMRMGREEEARGILEKALKADEFNIRVSNTLKVLKHLDQYETLKTAHFHLRHDPKHDSTLARYMAGYLEEMYEGLAKQFNYRPKGPILIELFNNHHMFSGRTVALPDLHTIGACTGRIITMVSPRDRARVIRKPFNWARVLKHELVHIFNLEQTKFLVPHWYTEGLAVSNEGFPRPPEWNKLLVRRFPNELMNLSTINMGFIKPRTREDWNLAYLQSQLYVEYLVKTYKTKSVGELLGAYREGLDTAAAIKKVCKVDKAVFEKGYKAHLESIVKALKGKAAARPLLFEELQKAHKQNLNDPDIAGQLAERYLDMGDKKAALKLARKALEKKKNQPLASLVQAKLLLAGGEEEKALDLLKGAVDRDNPELKVLSILGDMYFDNKKFSEAGDIFELASTADPYETGWLVKLARVYGQSKKNDQLIGVLEKLAPTNADDLDVRKRLAELFLKTGKPALAEKYARQALEIDVLDAEAQNSLEKALRQQKKEDALKELEKVLGK